MGVLTRRISGWLSAALIVAAGQALAADTFYVSPAGDDANPGTREKPFQTIQKGLDVVKPGDTCAVRAGTYKEALALKISGEVDKRITLQAFGKESVTVDSGKERSLRTNGRRHYYTIEGIHFVAEHVDYKKDIDYTLDFEHGIWDGIDAKEGAGNNGFILRNCVIDGAVKFYGHDIVMEGCELRGHDQWRNGVCEHFRVSYGNVYRNNRVSGYTGRGLWTMDSTEGSRFEGNTVFHCATMGIDLDGAGRPVRKHRVKGNRVYDIFGKGTGIEVENGFDCVIEGNLVHDVAAEGIQMINYGPDQSDAEYRAKDTNTTLRDNVIYNARRGGIVGYASPGATVTHNTVVGAPDTQGWFAGIAMTAVGKPQRFCSKNWKVRNNVVVAGAYAAVWIEGAEDARMQGVELSGNLYWGPAGKPTYALKAGPDDPVIRMSLEEFRKATRQEKGSVFADPKFVDPDKRDYRRRAGSPNAGASQFAR